tara:strand:+ start:154 stop:381 length:228 start_codon:yes stop_codon:yes gene_type:complete
VVVCLLFTAIVFLILDNNKSEQERKKKVTTHENTQKFLYSFVISLVLSIGVVSILKFYPKNQEKELVFMEAGFWE